MKKAMVIYDDFAKLDFRIGLVKAAVPLEESRKLISLTVDLGEDYGEVEILAGVAGLYAPDDLIDKKFIFLANLEPKPMAGQVSNGMMIASDVDGKPFLIPVGKELAEGAGLR